jgi:MFS-type transporter involved in bile tolerance (Atg22 family)
MLSILIISPILGAIAVLSAPNNSLIRVFGTFSSLFTFLLSLGF